MSKPLGHVESCRGHRDLSITATHKTMHACRPYRPTTYFLKTLIQCASLSDQVPHNVWSKANVLASRSSELLKKEEGRQFNKKQTQDSRTGASCMELGSHLNVACDVYKEETGQ